MVDSLEHEILRHAQKRVTNSTAVASKMHGQNQPKYTGRGSTTTTRRHEGISTTRRNETQSQHRRTQSRVCDYHRRQSRLPQELGSHRKLPQQTLSRDKANVAVNQRMSAQTDRRNRLIMNTGKSLMSGMNTTTGTPSSPSTEVQKRRSKLDGARSHLESSSVSVVRQPADGSCLFHSMSSGLQGTDAKTLRKEVADFIRKNPELCVSDVKLKDWIKWESGRSVEVYSKRLAAGGWGGGVEIAAISLLKQVNVHVFEHLKAGGYERISKFDVPGATKTIDILYKGGNHYDSIHSART